MRYLTKLLPILLCAACADYHAEGCSDDGTDDAPESAELLSGAAGLSWATEDVPPNVGDLWGPCDLTGVDSPDWWGCLGEAGVGYACARPLDDEALSICVPQLTPPADVDECDGFDLPFGTGFALVGGVYCLPTCESDDDCGDGRRCSAASGFCAWLSPG